MVHGDDPDDETVVPIRSPNRSARSKGDFAQPNESLLLVRVFSQISSLSERRRVIEFAQSILSNQK
jgi:hypothetical protein